MIVTWKDCNTQILAIFLVASSVRSRAVLYVQLGRDRQMRLEYHPNLRVTEKLKIEMWVSLREFSCIVRTPEPSPRMPLKRNMFVAVEPARATANNTTLPMVQSILCGIPYRHTRRFRGAIRSSHVVLCFRLLGSSIGRAAGSQPVDGGSSPHLAAKPRFVTTDRGSHFSLQCIWLIFSIDFLVLVIQGGGNTSSHSEQRSETPYCWWYRLWRKSR